MFLGEYERSLDDKGRLTIPLQLRAGLGSDAVLARSFDNCLCIYPGPEWERVVRAIQDLPEVRFESREIARQIYSEAAPCALDRQGRISVPAYLRDRVELVDCVIVAGVGSHLEIWSRDSWLERRDSFEADESRRTERLSTLAV